MTSKRGKSDFLELVKSDRPKPAKPPHLLSVIQQNLIDDCERLLKAAFLASDDAIFELSSRASSNSEESRYFESMRQVRIGQQGVSARLSQNLANTFADLLKGGAQAARIQPEPFTAQTLSILDGDELEVDLALKSMVTRARDMYREPVYELSVRLEHLVPEISVTEANNPLDPQQIARSFIDACADVLKIDIKVRLILFKLFEKHVLKQLAPVYANANQLLADAGIVPKVPRQLQKSEDVLAQEQAKPEPLAEQPEPAPAQASGENPQQPRFNVSFETLVSLMATARGLHQTTAGGQAATTTVVNCYIFATGNPGPLMTSPQLTSLLTRTQLLADRQLARKPRNIVPEVVNGLLKKGHAESPRALAETDETVINLVSLFFEQLLADDNLPMAVYALICRLQIPILKIALQDRSFFSRHDHPARDLINTITEIGVGFDESRPLERDPLYRKIADIVQTISREPSVNNALFADLHQELKALIQAEQLKINIVEKRTSQSAVGRSRIRNAKRHAQHLLYSKLHGVPMPLPVSEFLTTAWLQVLIISQLKHGHESDQWFANVDIVADLIWLCQRHQDVRSLQRREHMQYALMDRIEAGLEAAIESPEVRTAKVRDLRTALDSINSGSAELSYGTLTQEQKAALGHIESPDAAGQDSETKRAYRVAPAYLEKARNLAEGSWVEYTDDQTGEKCRYKLVAKADADAYVFVNRLGFKTLERSCAQLAHDMQTSKMKPLACTEFFDRMMNKVLSRISNVAAA